MVNITEQYAAMPSQKHSGRRPRTQILAVHSAEAPLERGYAKSLTNWSNTSNVQASWNAFADPGILVRAVNTYNAAWHASWANSLSIGYETAAYAAYGRDKWMSLEGRRMLERLAIEMAADAKIFDIPLRWLTGAQVNAVRAGNTNIKGLAAHRQIDPAYRTDPGDGFPYGYLLKRIKAHTAGIKPAAASGPEPIQEDEMKEADFDRIERMIASRVGDVVEVPNNQGTAASRKKNPTWTLSNAVTNDWAASNAAAHNSQQTLAIVKKLAEKSGLSKQEIKDAVTEALAESTVDVDISVAGQR